MLEAVQYDHLTAFSQVMCLSIHFRYFIEYFLFYATSLMTQTLYAVNDKCYAQAKI